MNKVQELAKLGQSIWYDYIRRKYVVSGDLEKMVNEGLRGMTSNPTIFEKAIAGSDDYDKDIEKVLGDDPSAEDVYEQLALKDIGMAADLMLSVFQENKGRDGFVSIEVNPHLAYKTEETIKQAKEIFAKLNRPNIMIKIPGTDQGYPAITEVIGSGINVNVTLIFGLDGYKKVAEAYIAGLEKLDKAGGDLTKVSSVASFFVSRVDVKIDKMLDEIGNKELRGKIAIANSKVAYKMSKEIFSGERWEKLAKKGAAVQRLLWASTSTKDPSYSNTIYVDNLIGPDTVNTVPPETYIDLMDHAAIAVTLDKNVAEAEEQLAKLSKAGIDLKKATDELQVEGVDKFAKSFDSLMDAIDKKLSKMKTEKI